jgi:lipid A 3-O-deacylase
MKFGLRATLIAASAGLLLPTVAPSVAKAEDPSLLILNAGVFDLVSHRTQRAEGRVEYRFGQGLFESDGAFRGFKPLLGLMANSAGAVYGYGGFAAPFDWGKWEFTPAAALGGYHQGNSIDLGGTFEFHLSLGLSYAVSDRTKLGLAIDHISNANTHPKNPGVNSILVTYAIALGR